LKTYLLALDSYGGTDPSGIFPLFFKNIANAVAGPLSAVFRTMLRTGSFPACWRDANIVPVPKGSPSPSLSQYRPISITPVLSKVYEKLVAARLARYFEDSGLLPASQYGFRKGLGTCDALLHISHVVQTALDSGSEARIVQVDLSAAFDRVNHSGLIFKLKSAGVGGSILSVLEQFLSNRRQCVVVDGSASRFVDVVSGVPQGSVLGPLLFILYTADMFRAVRNTLIGYADDATLIGVCDHPSKRVSVTHSLTCDLRFIDDWCIQWGMLLNPGKTKTMIVSRSRTVNPAFPALYHNGVVVEEVPELEILGVDFDSRMTFEKHLRSVASRCSQRIGLMRRAWRLFGSVEVMKRCFNSFVLPLLEYCSPVWRSSADCHLKLLDGVVSRVAFMLGGGNVPCDLSHRRGVSALSVFYKIFSRDDHPLRGFFPERFVAVRSLRRTDALHEFAVVPFRCRTSQYSRTFFPSCAVLWNRLPGSAFDGVGLGSFKSSVNRDMSF